MKYISTRAGALTNLPLRQGGFHGKWDVAVFYGKFSASPRCEKRVRCREFLISITTA
jgi:hypothetical protein